MSRTWVSSDGRRASVWFASSRASHALPTLLAMDMQIGTKGEETWKDTCEVGKVRGAKEGIQKEHNARSMDQDQFDVAELHENKVLET